MARRRLGCKKVLGGCGVLAVTGGVAFGLLVWRSDAALDRRAAAVPGYIESLRARLHGERPVRWHEPLEGNALHDYVAVERLLTPRGGARPDLDPRAGLRNLFARSAEARRAGDPVPEEAIDALATWGEAIEHVRMGLRRPRCDWQTTFEHGAAVAVPDLVAARCAAELMAISAQLDPDATAAVRTGLEIVGYGEDLTRHGTLVGAMVGVAVQGVGVDSLESTLRSRTLPRSAYEEVISTLATIEPVDIGLPLEADRVAMNVEFARVTGRGFGVPRGPLKDLRVFGPLFFEREWGGYERYMARLREATLLRPPAREPAMETILSDLRASGLFMARIALPNLAEAGGHADLAHAILELARMLAAAHLHRLENGDFPSDATALARFLGGELPSDPFDPSASPLRYRLDGDDVRCWSVGRDFVDQGGEGRWSTKEMVLITHLPRQG